MSVSFFKDLKVVELASVLAGPAVGMFFSELGAEVIKIENKNTNGDITRQWKLPSEDETGDFSAYYCAVNWNKRTLMLDLNDPADKEQLFTLIKTADVVISNFKKRSAEKLGIDYDTLKTIKPDLIFGEITAYENEPDKPAFDVVLQAETGFMYMNGEPGREPARMPVALIDILAAHQLKEAILIALLHRERTGKGSHVSASLFGSAIASLANQASNWLMAGHIPQRMGSAHPNIAPYGDVFYTNDDKPVTLAVGTDQQFKTLCEILGKPQLVQDERFTTNALRVKNREPLKSKLAKLIKKFSRAELNAMLDKNGVPTGNVLDMQEVFEQPEAGSMVLKEKLSNGAFSKCVRTVAFKIQM